VHQEREECENRDLQGKGGTEWGGGEGTRERKWMSDGGRDRAKGGEEEWGGWIVRFEW
jgi:hypothetical protein